MSIFKCKHPADMLGVEKSETREQRNNDFDLVTYHLYCCSCGQKVKISYAALRGGVAGFMGVGVSDSQEKDDGMERRNELQPRRQRT